MQLASLLRHSDDVEFETTSSRILLCGKSFHADPTGALYWSAENTLIVADLQLSNGSYLDGEDVLLPPYDTASAFEKLEEALDRYDPARVIALGNSFSNAHDGGLSHHKVDWLQEMMDGREWYWVMSPDKGGVPEAAEGIVVPHLMLGGIKFRPDPVRAPVANEIAGGVHPVAQVSQYGHTIRGRCFVSNGMRLILPSVGNYAVGSNVLCESFDPLLGQGGVFVWFLSNDRVDPVASAQLLDDQTAFKATIHTANTPNRKF